MSPYCSCPLDTAEPACRTRAQRGPGRPKTLGHRYPFTALANGSEEKGGSTTYRIELLPRHDKVIRRSDLSIQGIHSSTQPGCVFGVGPVVDHSAPNTTTLPPVVGRVGEQSNRRCGGIGAPIGIVCEEICYNLRSGITDRSYARKVSVWFLGELFR